MSGKTTLAWSILALLAAGVLLVVSAQNRGDQAPSDWIEGRHEASRYRVDRTDWTERQSVQPVPWSDARRSVPPRPLTGPAIGAAAAPTALADLEPSSEGQVTGRVVDSDTLKGAPNVTVTARRARQRTSTRSDADGYFDLGLLDAKRWRLTATAPHLAAAEIDIEVDADATNTVEWAVSRGGALAVRVVAEDDGSRIPLAAVDVVRGRAHELPVMRRRGASDLLTKSGVTDQEGAAVIAGLGIGIHQVVVRAEGYSAAMVPCRLGSTERLEVSLERAGEVRGSVRSAEAVAPGDRWALIAPTVRKGHLAHRDFLYGEDCVRVEADGTFRFTSVPAGTHRVCVTGGGFAETPSDVVVRSGEVTAVVMDVVPTASIEGRVTDEEGRAIPHARVYASHRDLRTRSGDLFAYWRHAAVEHSLRPEAVSSPNGDYALTGLRSAREVLVRVRAEGYAEFETSIQVAPAATRTLDLTLTGLDETVSGWIHDDLGQPVPGAVVVGFDGRCMDPEEKFRATSSEDGAFELPVPAGMTTLLVSVEVDVRNQDYIVSVPAQWTDVSSGQADLTFLLEAVPRVRGWVVDRAGTPVEAFEIVVQTKQGTLRPVASQGRDGSFDAPFDPRQHSGWIVHAPGHGSLRIDRPQDGQLITLPTARTVRGRVLDPDGVGIAGRIVRLTVGTGTSYQLGSSTVPSALTGEDGSFELVGVPEAGAELVVYGDARPELPTSWHAELPAAPAAVMDDILLPRAVPVSIQPRGTDGSPVSCKLLVFNDRGQAQDPDLDSKLRRRLGLAEGTGSELEESNARFEGQLAPGTYEVAAFVDAGADAATRAVRMRFDVVAGEPVDLELEVDP